MSAVDIESDEYKKQFLHEATKLAIESVEKGWGGPFGAVIVRDGKIIGRGQNRVLLTGIPVYHAEVTAIIDACSRINSKALVGSDYYEGNLKMIPRPPGSPDPVPERAQMLKGCDLYVNGAPCPMCMSAIYWARIDRVYFGTRLEDTSKIGFDDEFQYIDFRLPWKERKAIQCFPDFERDYALKACEAWQNKSGQAPLLKTELRGGRSASNRSPGRNFARSWLHGRRVDCGTVRWFFTRGDAAVGDDDVGGGRILNN